MLLNRAKKEMRGQGSLAVTNLYHLSADDRHVSTEKNEQGDPGWTASHAFRRTKLTDNASHNQCMCRRGVGLVCGLPFHRQQQLAIKSLPPLPVMTITSSAFMRYSGFTILESQYKRIGSW